jgi:RimJ/RimL family protein N-acetyltransferase
MTDIETGRLILRLLSSEALVSTITGDHARLEALLGLAVPEEWFEDAWVAQLRLDQIRENALYAPWSIRAVALKSTGGVIGAINSHDRPAPRDIAGTPRMAIEIGYSIYGPWRRRGFAFEAVAGYTGWAADTGGVEGIVMSISPGNAASLALARKLGGEYIGSQIDETDGPEDIFHAPAAGISGLR